MSEEWGKDLNRAAMEWKTLDERPVTAWGTGLYAEVGGRVIDITPRDDYPIFEWEERAPVPLWKASIVRAVAWMLRIRVEPYTL